MNVQARKSPLSPAQQTPDPTHADTRPLGSPQEPLLELLCSGRDQDLGGALDGRGDEGSRVVVGGGGTGGIRCDRGDR